MTLKIISFLDLPIKYQRAIFTPLEPKAIDVIIHGLKAHIPSLDPSVTSEIIEKFPKLKHLEVKEGKIELEKFVSAVLDMKDEALDRYRSRIIYDRLSPEAGADRVKNYQMLYEDLTSRYKTLDLGKLIGYAPPKEIMGEHLAILQSLLKDQFLEIDMLDIEVEKYSGIKDSEIENFMSILLPLLREYKGDGLRLEMKNMNLNKERLKDLVSVLSQINVLDINLENNNLSNEDLLILSKIWEGDRAKNFRRVNVTYNPFDDQGAKVLVDLKARNPTVSIYVSDTKVVTDEVLDLLAID